MPGTSGIPAFYYYPDASGTLEVVDFNEALTDIQESARVEADDAYAGDMSAVRTFHGSTMLVRILLDRYGTAGKSSRERAFQSMAAHLHRGGTVAFSRDHAKTWASYAPSPSRGDTVVYSSAGNAFSAWSAAGAVAAGDEMVVESAPPECGRELFVCGSLSVSPPLHIPVPSPGLIYTYSQGVVVRWRDFYPVLRLPKLALSKPFSTHSHRRTFSLDITLEYAVAPVLALAQAESGGGWAGVEFAPPPLRGTAGPGMSLEGLLGRPKLTAGVGSVAWNLYGEGS